MIARHFGKKVPVKALREHADMSRLGMSLKDLVECCDFCRLEAQGVRLGMEYVAKMPLPDEHSHHHRQMPHTKVPSPAAPPTIAKALQSHTFTSSDKAL